jgi:hypothetical protein
MRIKVIAALELALILPAALFLSAVFATRAFTAAQSAHQLVAWYAARMWTLWVLLLALPFSAFVSGCAALLHSWNRDMQLRQLIQGRVATLMVAGVTVVSGGILAIVVIHMAAS